MPVLLQYTTDWDEQPCWVEEIYRYINQVLLVVEKMVQVFWTKHREGKANPKQSLITFHTSLKITLACEPTNHHLPAPNCADYLLPQFSFNLCYSDQLFITIRDC